MKVFTTRNDLRNWVESAMGSDGSDVLVEAVTGYIQRQTDRPNWGEDWSEYLEGVDLWWIVAELGL
jgi:hypothetical protein